MGLEVQVYEQVETIRAVGAGLTLWPNAMNVLAQLVLAEQVRQPRPAWITNTSWRVGSGKMGRAVPYGT
jgi:2-polyprenyl-6-methoxyphenol hydroxylase-like FAD-dependent oxidoreductase